MEKEYLGDSVYVERNGDMLTLTTENGLGPSNTIHLEPEVQIALIQYFERLISRADSLRITTDKISLNKS